MIPGMPALPNIAASSSANAQGGTVGGSSFTFGGIQTGGSNMPPYILPLTVGFIALLAYLYLRKR